MSRNRGSLNRIIRVEIDKVNTSFEISIPTTKDFRVELTNLLKLSILRVFLCMNHMMPFIVTFHSVIKQMLRWNHREKIFYSVPKIVYTSCISIVISSQSQF